MDPLNNNNIYNNNNNNNEMNSTQVLVIDYINYRITKEGYVWENCPPLEDGPTKLKLTMQMLATEFETSYRNEFDDMANQLNVTPHTAYATFRGIVNELFSDGINWGRIVALFAFGGILSTQCIQRDYPNLVDSVVDWMSMYIMEYVHPWISMNGGWTGCIEYFEKGPEKRNGSPWPSFSKICGYAAVSLGAIAFVTSMVQKS